MPRSDIVVSNIRTWTPVVIGAALTWLGVHAGIVIDEQASTALIAGVQALVTSAYYAAFRLLERRWPALGWFLGAAKAPAYPGVPTTGQLTTAELDEAINRLDAQRLERTDNGPRPEDGPQP